MVWINMVTCIILVGNSDIPFLTPRVTSNECKVYCNHVWVKAFYITKKIHDGDSKTDYSGKYLCEFWAVSLSNITSSHIGRDILFFKITSWLPNTINLFFFVLSTSSQLIYHPRRSYLSNCRYKISRKTKRKKKNTVERL